MNCKPRATACAAESSSTAILSRPAGSRTRRQAKLPPELPSRVWDRMNWRCLASASGEVAQPVALSALEAQQRGPTRSARRSGVRPPRASATRFPKRRLEALRQSRVPGAAGRRAVEPGPDALHVLLEVHGREGHGATPQQPRPRSSIECVSAPLPGCFPAARRGVCAHVSALPVIYGTMMQPTQGRANREAACT